MKNPMTPEEMKQAIDDIADGYDMQTSGFPGQYWKDRPAELKGTPPDFLRYQYRRKPELIKAIGNIYNTGVMAFHPDIKSAITAAKHSSAFVRHVRLVEDPTWKLPETESKPKPMNNTFPDKLMLRDTGVHDNSSGRRIFTTAGSGYEKVEYIRADLVKDPTLVEPEPEETNPWRPIVQNMFPECKLGTKLLFRYSDGEIVPIEIDIGPRDRTDATEWKYAED